MANPDPGDWYNYSWAYRKKITIDHTKVAADLTNFAILFSVTDANLKDTTNGGRVLQADGGDILFTNNDGTKLDHEIEKYVPATGELVAWVEVDSLSSTVDTILYVYYGNASAVDQWNITGTWNEGGGASIKMVQHSEETDIDAGAGDIRDSTSNANNGTTSGMDASDQVIGRINGSFDFDGTNDYVNNGNNASLQITGAITVEAWIRTDAWVSMGSVVGKLVHLANKEGYSLRLHDTLPGIFDFSVGQNWNSWDRAVSTTVMSTGTWYQVVGTYDGSTIRVYLNGAQDGSRSYGNGIVDSQTSLQIGANNGGTFFDGTIDEVRVYNRALSNQEILTQYNNQNGSGTFYSIADEQTPPGGVSPGPAMQATPVVNVIMPNGGETLAGGSGAIVLWQTSNNNLSSLTIKFSTDGGLTYPDVIAANEANDGSYSWTVPSTATTAARVKVEAIGRDGQVAASDDSDANFTIQAASVQPETATQPSVSTQPATTVEQQPAEIPTIDPTASGSYSSVQAIAATPSIDVDKLLDASLSIQPTLCATSSLIKGSRDTVYYCGKDGKHYVFPNPKVFFTWYPSFKDVKTIADSALAQLQIGGNVTYRPGVRMIKIQTDPKVYAVSRGGLLRWVQSEEVAKALYGDDWNRKIDDVSDSLFFSYKLGDPIASAQQ